MTSGLEDNEFAEADGELPELSSDPAELRAHIKSSFRFFAPVSAYPFLTGFVSSLSFGGGCLMVILGLPIFVVILLAGTMVCIVRGIRRFTRQADWRIRTAAVATGPTLLILTIAVAWPIMGLGSYAGDLTRLALNYGEYQRIVAEVQNSETVSRGGESEGITYWVDRGPPVRVAFNPEGILDNWSGIVFDPTGDVMLANGFDPASGEFYAPDRVTELFDGDLMTCRHLWGDYYTCSFT